MTVLLNNSLLYFFILLDGAPNRVSTNHSHVYQSGLDLNRYSGQKKWPKHPRYFKCMSRKIPSNKFLFLLVTFSIAVNSLHISEISARPSAYGATKINNRNDFNILSVCYTVRKDALMKLINAFDNQLQRANRIRHFQTLISIWADEWLTWEKFYNNLSCKLFHLLQASLIDFVLYAYEELLLGWVRCLTGSSVRGINGVCVALVFSAA